MFHLFNTAAKGSHDQRTPEEGKRSKVTQPGGSSKENQGRKTTDGERDQLHSGTQTRDDTEPGILVHVDYLR